MSITDQDVQTLETSLKRLPDPAVQPFLVLVSGLPGTGKSFFSRRLAEREPAVVLETDALRRTLFKEPNYSAQESQRLFQAIHELVERLLGKGITVVLDATNLVERHREVLYSIAERAGAHLIIVRTEAPDDAIRHQMEERTQKARDTHEENGEADVNVYQRMRASEEKIGRNHFTVNTSENFEPVLQKIVRTIRRGNRV